MPSAEIISIGSELLLGQIVDTNSAWMSDRLSSLGVNLYYQSTVGDNFDRMHEVIDNALDRSDLVITGGGIGPTQDDITRDVVAKVTKRKLIKNQRLVNELESRFHKRGLILTSNNERQAYIPEGSIIVDNPNGTAPSFIVEDDRGVVICLPGVPFEMKWLFDNKLIPYITEKFNLSETIIYRVLKMSGIGESNVDDKIGYLIAGSNNPTVGVLAHPGQVDVRIAAKAKNSNEANKLIDPIENEIRKILGKHIFGVDNETIDSIVLRILRDKNITIGIYEDVTSGLLMDQLFHSGPKSFVNGIVINDIDSLKNFLSDIYPNDNLTDLINSPLDMSKRLSNAIRIFSKSNIGLALHARVNASQNVQNLDSGNTYISIFDGKEYMTKSFPYAGRGNPDRLRMSVNAIDLLRSYLIKG